MLRCFKSGKYTEGSSTKLASKIGARLDWDIFLPIIFITDLSLSATVMLYFDNLIASILTGAVFTIVLGVALNLYTEKA